MFCCNHQFLLRIYTFAEPTIQPIPKWSTPQSKLPTKSLEKPITSSKHL